MICYEVIMIFFRRFFIALSVFLSLVVISNPAYASDPCEVTLCLWGKMNGSSDSNCNSSVSKFFNIVKKGHHGVFKPGKTFDARKSFLQQECPAVYGVSSYISKILQKYGHIRF